MMRPALAAMILFCFFCAILAAGPALFDSKQLIVEESGLKLYPRFNKSLKPLAELKEGQVLTVLKELKSWKQVKVDETGQEGWIAVEVKWTVPV